MATNPKYLTQFYMAYSSRLEIALEHIMKTDDIARIRMIASAALGLESDDPMHVIHFLAGELIGQETEPAQVQDIAPGDGAEEAAGEEELQELPY